MGSFRHPKVFDPVTIKSIRDTFHDIMEELDEQVVFRVDEQRLKADIIERAIGVHQDLTVLARNLFKLRHQPLEIAGWERQQEAILRPICWSAHMF